MSLDELESVTAMVAGRVAEAVVGIGRGWGVGTGVVLAPGQVLTNAHNLFSGPGGEVGVTFADGHVAAAEGFTADVDGEVALLRVDTGDATPLKWAESRPAAGAVVLAAANPGGRGLRVTVGQVSAVNASFRGPRGRQVTGALEHTAPLPRGSSGGPLLDRSGRLVGLNTKRLGEGFYAALVADAALRSRIEALARGEAAAPRHLGVGLVPGRAARQLRRAVGLPDRDGVLVQVVEDDSPASAAGLRRGDLIVAAQGREVQGVDDLHAALDALGAGEELALGIVRGAEEMSLNVRFGADEGV